MINIPAAQSALGLHLVGTDAPVDVALLARQQCQIIRDLAGLRDDRAVLTAISSIGAGVAIGYFFLPK